MNYCIVIELIIYRWPMYMRPDYYTGSTMSDARHISRHPQRRSSCRCVIALRNVRTRRKKAEREWESRDDAMATCFPRETQFHVSSASAINACGLISRGGARERKKTNDATRADRVLEKRIGMRAVFKI